MSESPILTRQYSKRQLKKKTKSSPKRANEDDAFKHDGATAPSVHSADPSFNNINYDDQNKGGKRQTRHNKRGRRHNKRTHRK